MPHKQQPPAPNVQPKAGWAISEWTNQAGIAVPTYYTLPEEFRPLRAAIGRRVIIIEAPADWLKRISLAGGIPSRTQHSATETARPGAQAA